MHCCSTIPFKQLPFNKLFDDYLNHPKKIKSFFETYPFHKKSADSYITSFQFNGKRDQTVELLKAFNKNFDAEEITMRQIEKIRNKDTLTVVTGQQLTIYGGPLFTVYKIMSAIVQARKLEKMYNRTVIPVFWLADEDHDYEEASRLGILDRDDWHLLSFQLPENNHQLVGRIVLDEDFKSFREEIKKYLFDTDFTGELTNLLDTCYRPGSSFREAFGKLILKLFAKHGLVLAGSDDPSIKKYCSSVLHRAVNKKKEAFVAINDANRRLSDNGYHQQVQNGESNLFWIDDSGSRIKLETGKNGEWIAGNRKKWSEKEFLNEIDNSPEKFSPNVFLRPLIQDTLLPVVMYVAGPGELSYYAQMKDFYQVFGMKMPMIQPRFSATLLESNIDRIMEKLPFSIGEYDQRIEDLESEFIDKTNNPDVDVIFNDWKKKIDKITEKKKTEIDDIDPTLKGSAGKVTALYFTELDKLKGKVFRSVKQQEEINLKRIRKIKANLFPGGGLQERQVAFIYFMNKYGIDIWDQTISFFEKEEPVNHKVIRL